ncbi:hypothetical protein RHMOL_Rhmol12G0125500 [Rhododendron molle]|uniref:Uncharacterized protein n=1 Tax=Rhododendron molle TaxID=49168 RepID=A0ACC0LI89_RHOML|nr:hypothetical protein RHMOL_Rhmol12G0125500 [Rhododendron molle]
MNFIGSAKSSSSLEGDDFLIKQITLTHDPDGRHIDTELLLHAMETVMSYATISQVSDQHVGAIAESNICNIEVVGSEESLGHTIYKLSSEAISLPLHSLYL